MEFLDLDRDTFNLDNLSAKDINGMPTDAIEAAKLISIFHNHKTTCILHPELLKTMPSYLTISINKANPLTIIKIEGDNSFADNYCHLGQTKDCLSPSLRIEDIQLLFGSIGLLLDTYDNSNPLINHITTEHLKGTFTDYDAINFSRIMSATKIYRKKITYALNGYSRLLFFWEYCRMNSSVIKYANEARAKFLNVMTGKEIPDKNVKAYLHTMNIQVKKLSDLS